MAWFFDGINDSVLTNDDIPAIVDMPDSNWTILGRWKHNDGTIVADEGTLHGVGSMDDSHVIFNLINTDNFLHVDIEDLAGRNDILISTTTLNDTNDHSVVVTRIGDVFKLWIDGVSEDSGTIADFTSVDMAGRLSWGKDTTGSDTFGNVTLAEWSKFHRAFSDEEIVSFNKGYSALHFGVPIWYLKMIRDYVEVINDLTLVTVGTFVVDHPPMIYPSVAIDSRRVVLAKVIPTYLQNRFEAIMVKIIE